MTAFLRFLSRPLSLVMWTGLLWGAVHTLITLLIRFAHPFQLEWSEGSTFVQAVRFAREGVLYTHPWNSLFIPHLYTPLHTLVLGGALTVLPAELWVGRAFSLLCTLGTGGVVWACARTCGAGRREAWLPPLLLLALAPALVYWYDLVRVDMLFVICFAGSLLCHLRLLRGGGYGALVGSALLLILAFLAKQTALAYGPVFFLALLLWAGWRRALLWGVLAAGLLAGSILLCQGWSGGWFWFYCFEVLGRHGMEWKWASMGREMWVYLPLLLAAPLAGPLARVAAEGRCRLFCFLATGWGLPFAVYAYHKHGGFTNAWLPLMATLLPLLATTGPEWRRGLLRVGVIASLACALLPAFRTGGLLYNRSQVPLPGDALAQARVVERIAAVGGPVWCPNNVWVSFKAGGDILPLLHLIGELVEEGPSGGVRLPFPLSRDLQGREFDALLFCESALVPGKTTLDLLATDPRYRKILAMIQGNYDLHRADRLSWPSPLSGYQRLGPLFRPALLVPAKEKR